VVRAWDTRPILPPELRSEIMATTEALQRGDEEGETVEIPHRQGTIRRAAKAAGLLEGGVVEAPSKEAATPASSPALPSGQLEAPNGIREGVQFASPPSRTAQGYGSTTASQGRSKASSTILRSSGSPGMPALTAV